MTTNVIIQQSQPGSTSVHSDQWSTGIFDCLDDMSVCCAAYWCFPCFTCKTAADFGECLCLPLVDIMNISLQMSGIPCVPPVSLALRVGVRNRFGIRGDICSDCMYVTFCNMCSWCQIAREMKIRQQPVTIINSNPTVVSSQPTMISATSMEVSPRLTVANT
ncbi:cornifelin homolog [Paramormyrops kingsleyae]|uniref:Cornifelin homolog n=1 Tax=Paramormyrops kingsleyae TaxID=1676925 RepID=A0A3B3RDW9_9TELE|nr:cornifelin homolog [Paramormyrops kingsleyae]